MLLSEVKERILLGNDEYVDEFRKSWRVSFEHLILGHCLEATLPTAFEDLDLYANIAQKILEFERSLCTLGMRL